MKVQRFLGLAAIGCGLGMSLAACSDKGSDSPAVEPVAAKVQVLTVFAPGQLGDYGYADRVMKGVNTLREADADADSVELNFIASFDVESTREMLASQVRGQTSPLDNAPYRRRLVVLTEPFMVKWLSEVKDYLTARDEVLLLKVNEEDVNSAAGLLGMAGRVYGLNISAASAVKRFEEARRRFYEWYGGDALKTYISLMRLYDETVVVYRDSISETLIEVSPGHEEPDPMSILNEEGGLYSPDLQATAFQAAYDLTAFFWTLQSMYLDDANRVFTIADLGAANSGAEFFLMGSNANMGIIMLMLDTEPNVALRRFSITRYFDLALSAWMQQWLSQPAGSMPLMEQHGGWDGYCTDDIEPMAFF